ncbi:MAG: Crp/Fnr family transcriptional regulator [Parachlamydiales bacterium]
MVSNEIKDFPLFEGLAPAVIEGLLTGGVRKSHKHREVMCHAGDVADSFGVVLSGAYKLIKPTVRGDDIIVYFSTPGDVIGALLMSKEHANFPITAKAMGPSSIYAIPRSTFLKTWISNAQIQSRLNAFLYTRMSLLQDERALARAPLEQRVAGLLLTLLERSSRENDRLVPLPLTRQEIADSLGAAVESVIRVMSDWSQRGVIKTTDRNIEILRPDQVIEIVKGP